MAKKKATSPLIPLELKGVLLIVLSLVVLLSLLSFHQTAPQANWLGLVGYWVALSLNYFFGLASLALACYGLWQGVRLLRGLTYRHLGIHLFYCAIFLFSLCTLLTVVAESFPSVAASLGSHVYAQSATLVNYTKLRYNLGGVPFYLLYRDLPLVNLQLLLSPIGTTLLCSSLLLLSGLQLTHWKPLRWLWKTALWTVRSLWHAQPPKESTPKKTTTKIPTASINIASEPKRANAVADKAPAKQPAAALPPAPSKPISKSGIGYQLPPLSLLTDVKRSDQTILKKDLSAQAKVLEETLASFGIEAKVGNISCGPTITSFEVHPASGVKVQRIKALENDIALNLQAKSIRIIAPIPGKAAVGVEVPNPKPQEVSFKEMLIDYQQNGKPLSLPVLLGKAVGGEDVTADLTRMPHCIIAGATGSGKSVCINTIVMSILMMARPDEVKLLMVDPKKVELTAYTKLPHLIAPVITEASGACAALNWLVKEMERRYELLKTVGMRHIGAFNQRTAEDRKREVELGLEVPENLPYIVAIIDELADLMMVSSQDIETPIARIAQMARAVGIHLILATQRPSREVITGLIKANFPTRIAFKVSSRVNSQIILDEIGAESLLGNGDLLFLPPGTATLLRAQGAFIRDEDINRVIAFITNQVPPSYLIPSFDKMGLEDLASQEGDADQDPLYSQALQIVQSTGNASTTFLQRKLKIGYARAASLMDQLQANGIVGPQEGSRPRQVLSQMNEAAYDA